MSNYFNIETFKPYTVGFDSLLEKLETLSQANKMVGYPPYNIIKQTDEDFVIEIAVAGFNEKDLEIELKENILTIQGNSSEVDNTSNFLYKGIANRSFIRSFNLAETIEIVNAEMINGMLKIKLRNVIPEHKKARKIQIENKSKKLLLE